MSVLGLKRMRSMWKEYFDVPLNFSDEGEEISIECSKEKDKTL